MKAVCLTAPGEVDVLDVPEVVAGPGEVEVTVRAVGLCGSDLSVHDGSKAVPSMPWVLGHECGGTVTAVGEGVDEAWLGRLVVVEPNVPCGRCTACVAGTTSLCPDRVVLGMNTPGVLCERIAVPTGAVWSVPSSWSPQQLVSLEPFAVAVAAVRRSGITPGDSVVVVGAGSLGVQTCLALAAAGHAPAVSDVDPRRAEVAAAAGARPHADGETYDVVIETAGVAAALAAAVRLARPGGRVVLLGLPSRPAELPVAEVVRRGLTLIGSIIYDHPQDFSRAIDLASGPLVTASAGLVAPGARPEDASAAFAGARARPTKSWVDCAVWPRG